MIYENLYSKTCYFTNGKKCGYSDYLEMQVKKYPFHSGGQVVLTNGHKVLECYEYLNFKQLIQAIRRIRPKLK